MQNTFSAAAAAFTFLLLTACAATQPARDVFRELPLEGAPLAEPGPYRVTREAAFDAPGFIVFRPVDLGAFPARDRLPVLLWGNGGCNIDGRRYSEFLPTVASHGFLIVTTIPVEPEEGEQARTRATAADMLASLDWVIAENERVGSHLFEKIDTSRIAAMGVSCGGFALAAPTGMDPRVSTTGLLNTGLEAPGPVAPADGRPTSESLSELNGPVLLLNGGEVDFMYETSRENFELINHVPVFYGARDNAGHSATYNHPGGGEFANVISDWLLYVFKGDGEAGQTFVGDNCRLCTNPNWETASKGLE